MDNKYSSKRFIKGVGSLIITMMLITSYIAYIIDPNMYYRLSDYKKYFSEAYTTSGTIKNHNAEIAIIGSSMMQNTNMQLVRDLYGKEAIKYTRSGMNVDESIMLINRAIDVNNNVDKFIVNIDMTMFNTEKYSPYEKFPEYLYNDSKFDDIKYLLGFETWTKFIPFNTLYNICDKIDSPITNKVSSIFESVVDIDNIGNWSNGTVFGKDIVRNKYINNLEAVSTQNTNEMLKRMKSKFDEDFYPTFNDNNSKDFIIVLPPYSALMWYEAKQEGYLNILYDFKKYIVTRFDELENVTVFDFQDYDEIIDLNNYKDTTHYKPKLNDIMIEDIYNEKNIVNYSNIDQKINNLNSLIYAFELNNKDWL